MDNTGLVTRGPLSQIAKAQPSVLRIARRVAANNGRLPRGVPLRPGKDEAATAKWYMDMLGSTDARARAMLSGNSWSDSAVAGADQLASRQLRHIAGTSPGVRRAFVTPKRYNAMVSQGNEQRRLERIVTSRTSTPDQRAEAASELRRFLPKTAQNAQGDDFGLVLGRVQRSRIRELDDLKDYATSSQFKLDVLPAGRAKANAEAVRSFQQKHNRPSPPKPPHKAPKSWPRIRQEPTGRTAHPMDVSGEFGARAAQRNADRLAGAEKKLGTTIGGMRQEIADLQGVPGQEQKVANLQRWLPTLEQKQQRVAGMMTDRPRSATEPFGYTSPATQAQQSRQRSNQWMRNAAIGVGGIGLVGGTGWMAYRQDPSRMANLGSSRRERKPVHGGRSAVRQPTKRWWQSSQQRARRT